MKDASAPSKLTLIYAPATVLVSLEVISKELRHKQSAVTNRD